MLGKKNSYSLIYKIVFLNSFTYNLFFLIKKTIRSITYCKIYNNSKFTIIKKDIVGKNNCIVIGKNTKIHKALFRIHGNNNKIVIGENVEVGPGCSFWMEGNDISITIKDNCTFTRNVEINAQEDNSCIEIGFDCMFANTINIRTSDSHLIYDIKSNKRINHPKNIYIGNHVWITPNVKIMKGVSIGDNSIIGTGAIVTKNIEKNSLATGIPAKVVKNNINWSREKLF